MSAHHICWRQIQAAEHVRHQLSGLLQRWLPASLTDVGRLQIFPSATGHACSSLLHRAASCGSLMPCSSHQRHPEWGLPCQPSDGRAHPREVSCCRMSRTLLPCRQAAISSRTRHCQLPTSLNIGSAVETAPRTSSRSLHSHQASYPTCVPSAMQFCT